MSDSQTKALDIVVNEEDDEITEEIKTEEYMSSDSSSSSDESGSESSKSKLDSVKLPQPKKVEPKKPRVPGQFHMQSVGKSTIEIAEMYKQKDQELNKAKSSFNPTAVMNKLKIEKPVQK